MSKIVLPLAATCVALYFISRKRKSVEVEMEPVDEMSAVDTDVAELAVAAD